MSKLFINDEECTDNLITQDVLTFKDYMGGSTNKAVLKDDNGEVLDEKEFSLKTPSARWFLWFGTVVDDEVRIEVGSEFKDSNETTLELSKAGAQVMLARAKYAAPEGTAIPLEDIETFNNYFVEEGEPTDKLLPLKKGIEIFFDDVPFVINSSISKNGSLAAQVDGVDPELISKNPGAGIALGVTKKIVIKQVSTEDITEPVDFTINLKWV